MSHKLTVLDKLNTLNSLKFYQPVQNYQLLNYLKKYIGPLDELKFKEIIEIIKNEKN